MLFVQNLEDLELHCNTAVTIGKFDGFHKGHQQLLEQALSSEHRGLSSMVMTFTFTESNGKRRPSIMSLEDEKTYLNGIGVDYFLKIPVSKDFLEIPYDVFVKDILLKKLHAKRIFCGADFHFGKDRLGNVEILKQMGEELGFELLVVPERYYQGKLISSTRIRQALAEGNIEEANYCLGHNYTIQGEVVHGFQYAGKWGYPTANIIPDENRILPRFGVYDTRVAVDGVVYRAMTNIGTKPTITSEKKPILEAHLLDFNQDIYGKDIAVSFVRFIRPEMKFDSVELLKQQIAADVASVQEEKLY